MEELMELLKECCPMVDFKKEKHLWSERVLDSMDMVNIMSAIEDRYGVMIEYETITADNFDSADAIFDMIKRLVQGGIA